MDSPISIFQDCGSPKIVVKDKQNMSLRRDVILKIGVMQIEKKKDKHFDAEQIFLLTETHLHYISRDFSVDKSQVAFTSKAHIELGWLFSFFYVKEEPSVEFKMQLVKKKKRVKFKFENKMEFEEWKALISKLTLSNNLFDQFNVTSIIGRSDYTMVFKVSCKLTGEEFACKRYKKLEMDDIAKNKLIAEVAALRILRGHKNVVELFYVFESNCSVYIIQELCRGGKCVQKRKAYTEERLVFYFREIMDVLSFLRSRGIVHRGINPRNVLLKHKQVGASENEVKLIDFSSVYLVDLQFPRDPYNGTLGYLPPETIHNSSYVPDYSYDTYCAGVMLYNGLTGTRLFEHRNKKTSIHLSKTNCINFKTDEFKSLTRGCKLTSPKQAQRPACVGA